MFKPQCSRSVWFSKGVLYFDLFGYLLPLLASILKWVFVKFGFFIMDYSILITPDSL